MQTNAYNRGIGEPTKVTPTSEILLVHKIHYDHQSSPGFGVDKTFITNNSVPYGD